MPMQLYRPDLGRWVNQEIGANSPGLGPTDLIMLNILVELRLLSNLLEAGQPALMKDDLQNMRVDITKSEYPLNAY
jgi:hypothetical protein